MKTFIKPLIVIVAAASAAFAAGPADIFTDQCAKCHGADGKGQTKIGRKLNVRDMTTDAYKKELNDAKALVSLKEGIKKDGKEVKKSFAGELSDAELKALIAYVRALK